MRLMENAPFFRRLQRAAGAPYRPGRAPSAAIVGGRLYETATATHLASYARSPDEYEYDWLSEDLCRTPNGRLFLCVEGGCASIHHVGDMGGGQLLPLEERDAKQWLEFRGLVTEYVSIFGEPEAA